MLLPLLHPQAGIYSLGPYHFGSGLHFQEHDGMDGITVTGCKLEA